MKKTILLIFAFLTLLFLNSCSNNDDDNSSQPSAYQGNWSGTFTGTQDNGTWSANVNSSGVVTGTAISSVFSVSYQLNGTVTNNGVLSATMGTSSVGGQFNGQMNGTNANGTWINTSANMNGNWTGTKQ
jgi:hypothetical protein